MQVITKPLGLLWNALFLQRSAYVRMRDDNNPFVEGLYVLAMLGVVLGIAGLIGGTLQWASSPNMAAIRDIVLNSLKQMSWWPMMEQDPQAMAGFNSAWNSIWQVVSSLAPTPANSLLGILTHPLGLIIGWLVYGVLAMLFARLLGGKGTLNQTLGATALGAAPQLLNLVTVLPFVSVAGLGAWSLLCNYTALRTVHGLSWGRGVAAAVLPIVLGIVLASIGGFIGLSLLSALATGGAS